MREMRRRTEHGSLRSRKTRKIQKRGGTCKGQERRLAVTLQVNKKKRYHGYPME